MQPTPVFDDPFGLQRFVAAQASVFEQALAELRAGEKRFHWMWFIFPQISGLGRSAMARRYGIGGLGEACAYLAHPLLGVRLRDCTCAVNAASNRSLSQIFGYPDDLKFHSCITLFAAAVASTESADTLFADTLQQWFGGRRDAATTGLLSLGKK